MPMTILMSPFASRFLTSASSLPPTRREALRDLHREAAEALSEGMEMLAGQERGWHHNGHLLARQHGEKRRSERHFGLAEADIAADQPIHRPAAGKIIEHGVDARGLVLGLLIREARRELVINAVRRQ